MGKKSDAAQEVRPFLFTTRLIVIALALGIGIFLGYAVTTDAPRPRENPTLSVYMAILAALALVGRLVVPGSIFRAIRRKIALGTWQPGANNKGQVPETDEGLLMAALQTKTIFGCAILEAAGYANTFAYMTERQVASLVIALALTLMVAAHFPIRLWLDGWLERQKRWLDEERLLHPVEGHSL